LARSPELGVAASSPGLAGIGNVFWCLPRIEGSLEVGCVLRVFVCVHVYVLVGAEWRGSIAPGSRKVGCGFQPGMIPGKR